MDLTQEIMSLNQIFMHLNNQKTILFELAEGEGYIKKKDESFIVCIQPRFGSADRYVGNQDFISSFFDQTKSCLPFYVMQEPLPTQFRKRFGDYLHQLRNKIPLHLR